MPKISQLPPDTTPTNGDKIPIVDVETGLTKFSTRENFLGGNSITDPTLEGVSDGHLFSGKFSGWVDPLLSFTVASGYNKGNKEFVLTPSADPTNILHPGDRFMVARNTAPPTQCADLEASSSQYASRASASVAGITATDDITIESMVKLESYSSTRTILSRYNGTNGFRFDISANEGKIRIHGYNAGVYEGYQSHQSVPLGRWVHIAATLDLGTSQATIYIDGVLVANAAIAGGGALTTFVQAGDLEIGAHNGATDPFDGKLSDVRLWDAVRTATQIRDNMFQQLVGNEANLIGYWKLNGNFNDSTANANDLTPQAGAAATDVDNPMKSTEYAIITKVTASEVTVFTGTDHSIPLMTLNTPHYSPIFAPYGFPASVHKWYVEWAIGAQFTQTPVSGTWYNLGSASLSIPTGEWVITYAVNTQLNNNSGVNVQIWSSLGQTQAAASEDSRLNATALVGSSVAIVASTLTCPGVTISLSAQTIYYMNSRATFSGTSPTLFLRGDDSVRSFIRATCAYF